MGHLTTDQAARIFEICAAKVEQSNSGAKESLTTLSAIAKTLNEKTLPRTLYALPFGNGFTQKLPNDVISDQSSEGRSVQSHPESDEDH